jgi:hypothetical protein
MNRVTPLTLTTMALLCVAVAVPAGDALAQQKQHVSYKVTAENSKYRNSSSSTSETVLAIRCGPLKFIARFRPTRPSSTE